MRVLPIVFLALLFCSCFDSGDCLITNSNLVRITLKNRADNAPLTVTFTSIEVEGTLIKLYVNKAVSAIDLPVEPSKTSTVFLLNYGGQQQRIKFDYVNLTVIPSKDCGALLYQKDVKVGETTIPVEQIRTINNQLLKGVAVNFEILL